VAALGAIVHDHLGREVPGLRVLLAGAEPGAVVTAELRLRRPPATWESCFLGPRDSVRFVGDRLKLTLVGEALPKGILLPEGTEITAVSVLSPAGVTVRLANGVAHRGGPVAAASLRSPRWPASSGKRILLWQPVRRPAPRIETDPEARKRLEALGYAG
jgi:hypothetical protein